MAPLPSVSAHEDKVADYKRHPFYATDVAEAN